MDHDTSIKTMAAERYLLEELSSSERDEFELHFFECPECAESVRSGFQFGESAKNAFAQDARLASEPVWWNRIHSWLAWIQPRMLVPVSACIALAAFSGYQNGVQIPALRSQINQLEQPQVLATALLAPSSRSTPPSIVIPSGSRFVQLSLATTVVTQAQRYQCDLRTSSGKSVTTIFVPVLDPDATLNLLVPVDAISAGDYEVILSALNGDSRVQLERYRFVFVRK